MNKKNNKIFAVIALLTIVMAIVSVTFAYFTNELSGTDGKVNAYAATVGTITFDGGADFTTATDIEPGWSESKTFSIAVAKSDVDQRVLVKMDYTNNMPGLECEVTNVSDGAVGEVILNSDNVLTTVTLVDKTFSKSNSAQVLSYTLTMSFPETGENQSSSMNKTFRASMYAELASGIYYNHYNPYGTNTVPDAE